MKTTLILGVLLTLSTPSAYGQHMNEIDSPCAKVLNTAELGDCLSRAMDKADAKLNVLYKEIHNRLQPEDVERLTRTQRLWLQFRDANCTAERELYDGGTAKYPAYYACLESMTRSRTRELQVTYAVKLK